MDDRSRRPTVDEAAVAEVLEQGLTRGLVDDCDCPNCGSINRLDGLRRNHGRCAQCGWVLQLND